MLHAIIFGNCYCSPDFFIVLLSIGNRECNHLVFPVLFDGFAFTSSDLDGAVKSLSDILPDMIRLAECEKACQLMAAEIEKTRRRVNALEHVIIPETEESIKYITMKLDENERSTQIRLMKVKDMMLEEAHHYKEKEA